MSFEFGIQPIAVTYEILGLQGVEEFRAEVERRMGSGIIERAGEDLVDPSWKRRTFYGVHPQKQEGLNYIGLHVPVGRLQAPEMFELARIADEYGNGEIRITVEQNMILPNVPTEKIEKLMKEPLLEKYSPNPAPLLANLVACTGSQFCGQAIVETKACSLQLTRELDATMETTRPIRLHFTGCPNSCAQVQVCLHLLTKKKRNLNLSILQLVLNFSTPFPRNAP